MRVSIEEVARPEARKIVKLSHALSSVEEKLMDDCLKMSTTLWVGLVDDALACLWGVIPPTLMSNDAYLWLYTTPLVEDHQFTFVRRSQIVIKELLEQYDRLVGYCLLSADRSIKWLSWLGAEFGRRDGTKVAFVIRKK